MVPRSFFNRKPVAVARDLLGMYLVRKFEDGTIRKYKIVETESYGGAEDKASHASRGQTARNEPMFGVAGTIYVYFTYGMHYMLNIVCGPKGKAGAVLIRGVEGVSGPGRLTKQLQIDKRLNQQKLGTKAGLWIEINSKRESFKILRTPRIGIAYAGPIWARKLHRFVATV